MITVTGQFAGEQCHVGMEKGKLEGHEGLISLLKEEEFQSDYISFPGGPVVECDLSKPWGFVATACNFLKHPKVEGDSLPPLDDDIVEGDLI